MPTPLADPLPDGFAPRELAAIEQRTREVATELFTRLQAHRPRVYQRSWWDERVMQWAMRDEALKVQLFRFVDCLPMLGTDEAVAAHLLEHLAPVGQRLPVAVRTALQLARANRLGRRALARAARRGALDYARRFIAGTRYGEVLRAAQRERQRGRAFTLDILGEAVISRAEAEAYFRACVELLENVAAAANSWPEHAQVDRAAWGVLPRANLSLKLSALDSQFDAIDPAGSVGRVAARLRELLRVARQRQAFLNIDMESYATKELVLEVFRTVLSEPEFRAVEDVGIVVQCYLRDAARDLVGLQQWAARRGTPVWVRLVKGAYWDYETAHARAQGWPVPVFQQKWQSDASFEQQTRYVMRHADRLRPALGTHNLRSIAQGIAVAQHLGLPRDACEMQMLYGMGDEEKRVLVELGYRLRVYMPFGPLIPGMAYLVRRLLENTSNDSFLRASFGRHASPDQLLRNPLPLDAAPETAAADAAEPTPVVVYRERPMPELPQHPIWPPGFHNQPPVDFSRAEERQALAAALEAVRQRLGGLYPLWIGGQAVESGQHLVSVNPSSTGQVIGTVAVADAAQVARAVAAAREALPAWSARPVAERAAYLRRAAEVMRTRLRELAAWEILECGKPWREATADVCEAIDFCAYYAACAESLLAVHGVDLPGEANRFGYLPRGVAAVIAPWNFPLAILTGMSVAALVTGNPVVMKPAEQSPVTAWLLMEMFTGLGLPPGVLNYLPGPGEVAGTALVEHPDVALIAFTGSRAVGLAINARAADVSARAGRTVKRVIAEMGGKNAIVVDEDADLDEAVQGVVHSAFGYQGQKCSACSRAIVVRSVYDAFLNRLVEAARSLQIGPADDPATHVGPVIDAEAVERIRRYIALGREEGREVLARDVGPRAEQGYFVGPHIFADVAPTARIAQEEIFGPVLAVIPAADFEQAIRIANDTDFALTAGIYSRRPAHLERARQELLAGNLYLNRAITGALVGRQPFGGFRMSGIGSQAGGPDYLLQFVLPRTVTENTMRRGFAPTSPVTPPPPAPPNAV